MPHNAAPNLSILSWNCQSIRNKATELQHHLHTSNIDIAVLCETWLTLNHQLKLQDYTIHRRDRANGEHGGVAVAIKSSIKHSLLLFPNTQVIEAIGIKVMTPNNHDIDIVSCYFPGGSNRQSLEWFKKDIDYLTSLTRTSYFLIGDFNSKHRLWNNIRSNVSGVILYNQMSRNNFVIQYPPTPTYHPPQTRALYQSTIDICITNNVHSTSQMNSLPILSSDHNAVEFTIYTDTYSVPRTKFRFDLAKWANFQTHVIQHIDPNTTLSTEADINCVIHGLTDTIQRAIELHVPKTKYKTNTVKLPTPTVHKISLRNTLRRQWQRTRLVSLRRYVNKLTREIAAECRTHRNKQFGSMLQNLDFASTKFWRATKIIKQTQNCMPPLHDTRTNTKLYNNIEKATAIGKVFENAHHTTHHMDNTQQNRIVEESLNHIDNTHINRDTLVQYHTTPSAVKNIIRKSKNKKAPGYDNINNFVIKHLPNKCIVLLTNIYNACINIGYFPTMWKSAKVIAIPKPNKDNTNPQSYRPISLLSSLSKIFESTILNKLEQFTESHHIIPDTQFGFRKHMSTVHQLARVTKHIQTAQHQHKSTGLVTLDIEKAFDSIWHDGLIHKLHSYHYPLALIKIVNSYIRGRSFSVHISSEISPTHQIVAGLPQGSCLSPLLYNIYTADIPQNRHTQLALFADDTAIYCSDTNPNVIVSKLEATLTELDNYFTSWKIKVNNNKTQSIFFTKRRAERFLPNRCINFKNTELSWNSEIKYLGVMFDKKLSFKLHCQYANEKAQKYVQILYPLINRHSKLNIKNKLLIFKCIFKPMLLYAGPVWSNCADNNKKCLQVTQNKILKLAFNLPFFYSTVQLHILANTQPIKVSLETLTHQFRQNCTNSSNEIIANI